ncbi:MAG: FAD-binding oxidoreductase, partial [Shewanella sp.]|nr:FAD-binding oxidoreductase [Shewanella sp.]
MSADYSSAADALIQRLGAERVSTDPVRRFAWSTDASYFRIVPEIVVHADELIQVKQTLAIARRYQVPVTFRAAGTSLSGQAIGEGILLILGYDGFRQLTINKGAQTVTLGAAITGAEANAALKPFDRKIGPDPATLASARIGGIVSNNSSGMCCGTTQNSYQTIQSARLLFADDTELDTGSNTSRDAFRQSHPQLLQALEQLAHETRANPQLSARIRHKYSIKNTTGYSLNALVDFSDPFDLINHLIVGAEGTLAFVEEVTYHTVAEARYKASALAVFYSMEDAANAIPSLNHDTVAAAELLDWASIRAVTGKPGMPDWLATLPQGAAILLIESRAHDEQTLAAYTDAVLQALSHIRTERPICFSQDPEIYGKYWAIRSGLFPIVGAERPKGTSVIIEDVAFRVEDLAAAAAELSALFHKHGYPQGVIYGHALAGNFHFIITPAFTTQADIQQFDDFMQDVARMVIDKYDGSMKAEHGTGRAVAPFVEMEWGADAYALMKRIKQIFDPLGLLNPGVLLNDDKQVHIKQIKACEPVDELVDTCIECGFCEKTCPTSALNLTPRQRIATLREIARLKTRGEQQTASELKAAAKYDVIDTCTACQLCTIACPVDNSMGKLVQKLRTPYITTTEQKVLDFQAKHYAKVNGLLSGGLTLLDTLHRISGDGATRMLMQAGRALSHQVPVWNPDFPKGGKLFVPSNAALHSNTSPPCVVYFPSCGGRTFGPTLKDPDERSLPEVVITLLQRAGYRVAIPDRPRQLCCGQMWESKGDFANADAKRAELVSALEQCSQYGKLPVIIDSLSSIRLLQ